jgi:hypothetical protein
VGVTGSSGNTGSGEGSGVTGFVGVVGSIELLVADGVFCVELESQPASNVQIRQVISGYLMRFILVLCQRVGGFFMG